MIDEEGSLRCEQLLHRFLPLDVARGQVVVVGVDVVVVAVEGLRVLERGPVVMLRGGQVGKWTCGHVDMWTSGPVDR